jgi:hypothetical protein
MGVISDHIAAQLPGVDDDLVHLDKYEMRSIKESVKSQTQSHRQKNLPATKKLKVEIESGELPGFLNLLFATRPTCRCWQPRRS